MKNINFLDYCNEKLKSNEDKKEITDKLDLVNSSIIGRACWRRNMPPGGATGFVIYLLDSWYREVKKEKLQTYLEVGTLWGGSLCALYSSKFDGVAYGLDIYEGYYGRDDPHSSARFYGDDHMQVVMDNCAMYDGIPKLITANTQKDNFKSTLDNDLSDVDLDVLLIDGDHSYNGAICDYNKLHGLVKKDGLLLVDNYEESTVQEAVEEIRDADKFIELGVWNRTTWIAVKK